MTTAELTTIQKLGTLVWDTIAELSHRGETRLDLDSAECAQLRKAAYDAVGNRGDDRRLAFTTLEWLQGMASFAAVQAASQTYEKNRIK
jgi:hypothetical protein